MTTAEQPLRPFQKGPEHRPARIVVHLMRTYWCTHGRRVRTGLVQLVSGRLEQNGRVDQPVITFRNDEALAKVTSHQGFLSG